MRARPSFALVACIALFAAAATARADDEQAKPRDPVHEYLAQVHQGLEKIVAGEHEKALELLRAAKEAQPSKPHAAYYEAVALELSGDRQAAITAYRAARVLAAHAGEARFEVRALQGAAMALEASEGKRGEAKAAWEELAALLESNPGAGDPAVATSRLEMIELAAKTEAAAAVTRRAIEAREAELREQEAEKAKKKKKSRR